MFYHQPRLFATANGAPGRTGISLFQKKVSEGVIKDNQQVLSKSPFTAAIQQYVKDHPNGCVSREVINHLMEFPEFQRSLLRNTTHVHNVLTRLVRRGEIRKEGRTFYPLSSEGGGNDIGAEASDDSELFGAAKLNGALPLSVN
jgi:hypothetical protein